MEFRIIVQHLFGEEHLRRQAKVLKALETQPWAQKDDFYYLTRTEWYVGPLVEMRIGSQGAEVMGNSAPNNIRQAGHNCCLAWIIFDAMSVW